MVDQVCTAAVVAQEHDERVVAIALCRTPEVRVDALEAVIPKVAPVAGRQRRERVGIRAIAATVPASCRFEFCSRRIGTTNCGKQRIPFRLRRQVPACWANTTHRIRRRACFTIAATLAIHAPCASRVHRDRPRVKATVLGAVRRIIFSAIAIFRFEVQVLSHPRLGTNNNSLVGLTIAGVR